MTVFFECDNDEELLKVISIPRKDRKHCSGKSKVCKDLKRTNDSKGIVDEDPQSLQDKYITSLGNPTQVNHDVNIYIDNNRNNKIVMLCPRLEEWLYKISRINKINPVDYGLPGNPDAIHKEEFRKIKTNLTNFLNDLLNTGEFIFLRSQLK